MGTGLAMKDSSRAQGWAICASTALLALLFVAGLLHGSYLALAVPVAVVTLFALGLAGWVGYTIATVQVEPDLPHDGSHDAPPGSDATERGED